MIECLRCSLLYLRSSDKDRQLGISLGTMFLQQNISQWSLVYLLEEWRGHQALQVVGLPQIFYFTCSDLLKRHELFAISRIVGK